MTVEQYVQESLDASPVVKQASEDYENARRLWLSQVGSAVLPSLAVTGTAYPWGHNALNGNRFNRWRLAGDQTGFDTTASWVLFNSFKDYQAVRLAALTRDSSAYSLRAAQQALAIAAIRNYFDLNLKNMLLEVNRENLKAQQDQDAVTRDLYNHGLKSLGDLLKSETDLHSSELRAALSEAERKKSLLRFNLLIDRQPDAPAEIKEDLDPGTTELPRLTVDLGRALAQRPEIQKAQADLDHGVAAFRQSIQNNLLPTLAATAVWNRSDLATFGGSVAAAAPPNPKYYFGLTLSLPLGFNLFSQAQNVLAAKATERKLSQAMRDTVRTIRQEAYSSYIDLEQTYISYRVATLKESISRRSLDLALEQYRQGAMDAIRLAQSRLDYLDARTQRSQAIHDAFINRAQYKVAIGDSLWK